MGPRSQILCIAEFQGTSGQGKAAAAAATQHTHTLTHRPDPKASDILCLCS